MRKATLLTLGTMLAFFFAIQPASAQGKLGIGVIVGEPTGISVKTWANSSNAFAGAAAWSFADNPSLQLQLDYLYHRNYFFDSDDLRGVIPWYFGIGGRIKMSDDDDPGARNAGDDILGVRFPVGIGKTFDQAPVELFLEVVPIMDIAPETDFSINGALGARYYFN